MQMKQMHHAYDRFLKTGKVSDYLTYITAKNGRENQPQATQVTTTGEHRAHNNGRDRNPGVYG